MSLYYPKEKLLEGFKVSSEVYLFFFFLYFGTQKRIDDTMAHVDAEFAVKGSSITREWSGQLQPALVATFLFLICLEAGLWVRNLRLKRRLPGPFAWPVVGNAMQLGQMPHITFAKLAEKYGNVYQIRLGCNDIVVLNGDRAIRQALIQHSTEFAGRPNFVSFQYVSGGKSLTFTSYSKEWKIHRKIAQSTIRAFSSANSQTKKAFEWQIVAEAKELVEIFLKLGADGDYFNPSHELTVAAANVICALCFGKRYGHDDAEFRALLQRVNDFGQTVGAGSLVDVMPWLQSFPNPVRSVFKNFKHLNKEFFSFVQSKVEEHRKTFNPEVTRDMSDAIIGVIDETKNDKGLSEDYTEGTVADLIGAGLDTVSTALDWILLLLVKHPEIQTRLQQLVDEVVGPNRLPSVEDRGRLAPLDAFIYETMRFSSFVPITIPHSTTSDVTIEGLCIPKDTVVFINQWSINHDPLKWKDPQLFDPSRFLDENGALDKDLTNNVMIFSAGKRRCIGDQIAKVEIFLFFAILLQQCHFEKCPHKDLSLDCAYGLTLRPLDFKITAKPRQEKL
ncbi:cytochrome P450 1B1-like [Syngnathoides biaculeatus]|uniref:cytochrome P450 1B1-like n=1 Tax=Syngnathoides biaculeatus TaxID=300417 RepID=UPI002ADE713B|nr:cytochrome P450 1B1-like [Syngnathoides biaculeatus]